MATQVIMPKLGMAMKEGILAKWVKDDGSNVEVDETIAIVITKKITYELKAAVEGILRHKARSQEALPVGAVIGYILAPGEAIPDEGGAIPPSAVETPAKVLSEPAPQSSTATLKAEKVKSVDTTEGFIVATPAARRAAKEALIDLASITGTGPGGKVTEEDVIKHIEARKKISATSSARKLAEEHHLDLASIKGTGPGGRIVESDVQEHLHPQKAEPLQPQQPGLQPELPAHPPKTIPFSGLRQIIAENMLSSLHSMAQVTISTEVDMTELVVTREYLKKNFEVSYTDLIVKAVTVALKKHPRLNAALVDDAIQISDEINIGVGVALEEGLVVPVLRNADRLSVEETGIRLRDLAARARSDSLSVDEVSGGTFTISNLGMYGIDMFTPVINPPEVAILGVGRIVEKLVIYRGETARRSMMVLSLTFDHRVIDGVPAAAFLQTLSETLTHPYFFGN